MGKAFGDALLEGPSWIYFNLNYAFRTEPNIKMREFLSFRIEIRAIRTNLY
jgi:hypothetical protein